MTEYHSIPRINWGSFRGRREEKWGSFRCRFGDHFRVGGHCGVGIISGAVQLLLSCSEFEPWFLPRFPIERFSSLSIRRFGGKGERWKQKRERAEGEKLFFSPPPLSPIVNLLYPSPLGRPDTQASVFPTEFFFPTGSFWPLRFHGRFFENYS